MPQTMPMAGINSSPLLMRTIRSIRVFAVRMRVIEVRIRVRIGVSPCALNFRVPRAFNFVE